MYIIVGCGTPDLSKSDSTNTATARNKYTNRNKQAYTYVVKTKTTPSHTLIHSDNILIDMKRKWHRGFIGRHLSNSFLEYYRHSDFRGTLVNGLKESYTIYLSISKGIFHKIDWNFFFQSVPSFYVWGDCVSPWRVANTKPNLKLAPILTKIGSLFNFWA